MANMVMIYSIDILERLYALKLLENAPKWWWVNAGSFEVILGCVLVQNSKWENVQKTLHALRKNGILPIFSGDFETDYHDEEQNYRAICNIAALSQDVLSSYIFGLQNQKAQRLILLAQNLLQDFESYTFMTHNLTKEWLLAQKGLGLESADCVLNYMCKREVMVVDRYTYKLLCALGIEIPDYDELQSFFMRGVKENIHRAYALYGEANLAYIYARFHAKIVEFGKRKYDPKILIN